LAVPFAVTHFGAVAYVYTQVISCVIGLTINALFFHKHIPQLRLRPSIQDGLRLLSCSILAFVPAAVYDWYWAGSNVWLTVGIGGMIFVVTLAALTYFSGDFRRFLRAVHQTV
jgi:hypothetical protein